MNDSIRIAALSFTETRNVQGLDTILLEDRRKQHELSVYLRKRGFEVQEPLMGKCVNSRRKVVEAARDILTLEMDCVVAGCWKWTAPMLVVELARRVNLPIMLVGDNDPKSTSLGCMAAVGAALWEVAPNEYALRHGRSLGDPDAVVDWALGAGALTKLRRGTLLLWGGSYCLRMPHLEDDHSALKSFLVGDILTEDQYVLVKKADEFLNNRPELVDDFVKVMRERGMRFEFDGVRFTPEVLRRQAALYMAARTRLDELRKSEEILGVSVRCQPEISEMLGVTACIIPSLLPYPEKGKRPVAAVCEGDLKGLITSVMLQLVSGLPAGFGDIRALEADGRPLLAVSNCGGASVYYSRLAGTLEGDLPGVTMSPQCQGEAGGAVGYRSPGFGEATVARLIRRAGEYRMQYFPARAVEVKPEWVERLGWGKMWPMTMFEVSWELADFAERVGSNHFSFVPGGHARSLEAFCAAAGIETELIGGNF
ncbi:MAG: fucose isomerase [bacterium]